MIGDSFIKFLIVIIIGIECIGMHKEGVAHRVDIDNQRGISDKRIVVVLIGDTIASLAYHIVHCIDNHHIAKGLSVFGVVVEE